MSHNPQTRSKTRGGRSDSLDRDVRCRIKITTQPSMNIIIYPEPLDITIYQLLQVYKVNHLKQQLVNELSQFKCVLDALPKPPCRMISATLTGTRREKLKDDIIQLLNKFSSFCEECTVSRQTYKILKDSDFLFTIIDNRGSEIDIVYCKNDSIEWAVDLRSWSEAQKLYLMSLLDKAHQTMYKLELNGNKIRIFTNPQTIDLIHVVCCNIGIDGKDKGDYDRIHRSTSNETHVNTNIGNGKDGLHNNNSQWQSPSSPSTEPGDRCACNNSQWQPTSSSNTESENIYAQKDSQWQPSSSSSTGPENTNAHDNSHGQSLCSSNTKPEERYTRNNSQWHTTSSSNTEPEDRSVNNNPQGHSMSSQNTEPEDRYGNLNSEGQSMSCSNREPGDIYAHNNSQGQPTLNSNVDPGDRYVNNDSQWQSPSSSNTETGDMTIHDKTNVPSTTLLEACDGAVPGPVHGNVRIIPDRAVQLGDSRGVLYHPGNGQDADLGGNTDEKGDNGTGTHTEDKCRLSSTSQDTTNYKNKDRYDVNRIDLIYLKLFTKRKPILDKILYCFSQSGYNQRLRFNEDGSTEPSLNNEEFFALNVAIIKFLDIKRVSLKQYDLPDGWVDSMNIIENSIVVEKQETYIFIVGLKDIVQRVLLNLRQYTRKGGVSTDDLRGEDINEAVEGTEYLGPYSIGINCPLDCEYICKEGDHLLYELQKTYSCFIDIQPLVTGTKEIHFANWIYNSKGAGHIEIPLIIGDHRTLPDQSDILVLEQNQTDQSYESGQQSSDNLAHYRIMPDHSKRHLEDRVKNGRYKTLILLMDKTTKKETVSFFYRACKNLTKRIYLPMKSRPQVNCYLLQTLFEKGELKYGGQDTLEDVQHHQPCKGHYIEMKIGQINNQKVS
ncbi:uncharacterized protein LOC126821889 isoform X2 [Patella vulgata]|uniref:uncharacterized protein LOC126821889 isoform X2 n=1 Tax=Patella vulgata TaxID=6465 RepID=UPI00217FF01C|nr:uncharacterized protein LOC126821889 isoform X2 [Patella vulgata]